MESAVTKNGKRRSEPHECVYVGPEQEPAMRPVEQIPTPPSIEFAKMVSLSILGGNRGCYRPSVHLQGQMRDRDFDIFDIEYAIKNGKCMEDGEYSHVHKDFKYVFRCDIDGVPFDAVIAISSEYDLLSSPLLILITGCWKNKTGRRRRRY
jgi:hypothetical protein